MCDLSAGDPGWLLLLDRGAATMPHPGGTLGAHLQRVGDRLEGYGVDSDVVRAGRCHAAYGTHGFPTALVGLDERDLLRDRIGERAEDLVHEYCSCDRARTYPGIGAAAPTLHDRWTNREVRLSPGRAAAFCAITVANELDIVDQGAFDEPTCRYFLTVFRAMAPHLPATARDDVERTLAPYDTES